MTRSLGADIVIAVDVNSEGATFMGSVEFGYRCFAAIDDGGPEDGFCYQLEMSDFVISPKVGHIRWDEMGRAEELIAAGYEAGLEILPKIRELIDSAANKEAQRQEMLA